MVLKNVGMSRPIESQSESYSNLLRAASCTDRNTIQKPIPKKIKTTTAKATKNCGVATDRKSQLVAFSGPPTVLAGALWMVQAMYATVARNAPWIEVAVPAMKAFRKFQGNASRESN
jgi:hypothetical protein